MSGSKMANQNKTSNDEFSGTEKETKPTGAATLEEDDEFEDFPVENWSQEETENASNSLHLWEESWDDDDASEDFSIQLKEELKKVEANKKS